MKDKINATVKYSEAINKYTADAVYMGGLFIGTGATEIDALENLKAMLINKRLGQVKGYPRQVAIEF